VNDLGLIGRTLISLGAVLLVIGLALLIAGKIPHVGRLPGDIVWKKGGFTFYFPLMTCLLLSLLVSSVLWLLRK
jgi:hypothetical protein